MTMILAGTGYVCNTYRGSSPYPVDITRMFNLSDEICKRYTSFCNEIEKLPN